MNVPFLDLKTQYRTLAAEIDDALHGVMANADFILGKDVELFEREFAAYCGVPYAVGLDSGISALELALRALGIGPGDEVITVSHTFIATVSAISFTGAKPVFVDVRPDTFNLDTRLIEAAISPRTKAILPVHLYGQPADIQPILDVARKYRLAVVEDACQAHGARYRGQRAGTFGEAGCFSFYPGKNLGAFGDAGMLVTRNRDLAEKVRMLRNYGQSEKYHHLFLAYNHRLDTMQAAVLRVKLKRLDDWNAARQKLAQRYRAGLAGLSEVVVPTEAPDRTHVYHLYVIQHPDRDGLAAFLRQQGIATGLHYPIPVHRQPCYESLGVARGSLPVTEHLALRILTLPMFPEMTAEQVDYVCAQIRNYSSRKASS